jgi:hypothetical protein
LGEKPELGKERDQLGHVAPPVLHRDGVILSRVPGKSMAALR